MSHHTEDLYSGNIAFGDHALRVISFLEESIGDIDDDQVGPAWTRLDEARATIKDDADAYDEGYLGNWEDRADAANDLVDDLIKNWAAWTGRTITVEPVTIPVPKYSTTIPGHRYSAV